MQPALSGKESLWQKLARWLDVLFLAVLGTTTVLFEFSRLPGPTLKLTRTLLILYLATIFFFTRLPLLFLTGLKEIISAPHGRQRVWRHRRSIFLKTPLFLLSGLFVFYTVQPRRFQASWGEESTPSASLIEVPEATPSAEPSPPANPSESLEPPTEEASASATLVTEDKGGSPSTEIKGPKTEKKPTAQKNNFRVREEIIAFVGSQPPEGLKVTLTNSGGRKIEAPYQIEGEVLTISPPPNFHPGQYHLKVTNQKEETVIEQDFTWGVLAINTNKSIYSPGEDVYLQMASLDKNGHTICDADLKLEIRDPNLETKILATTDSTIKSSESCGPNNVTDNPDYFAFYKGGNPGTYQLKLTNLGNGFKIEDSFEVKEAVPFEVERVGATRINPYQANYTMTIKIKANQDFTGEVVETIPDSFDIKNKIENIKNEEKGSKSLIWSVDWEEGKNYELSYEYDAPDKSPQFYLLGPLTLFTSEVSSGRNYTSEVFRESRSWQIAADSTCSTNTNGSVSWNDPNTWTSCNSSYPGATITTDTVEIKNVAIAVAANVSVTVDTITFTGGNKASSVTIGNGITLTATGAVAINAPTGSVVKELAVTSGALSAAGITIKGGSQTGRIARVSVTSGTVTTSAGISFTGSDDQFTAGSGSTVNLTGTIGAGAETFTINSASTLNSTGTSAISGVSYIFGIVNVNSGSLTLSGGTLTTFAGALTVANGATLSLGNYAFTASSTTTVGSGTSGIINATGSTGTYTFTGAVTVNAGGSMNLSDGTHATSFGNGIAVTAGAATPFNAGTGAAAVSATQAFSGTGAMAFGSSVTPASGQTITNTNSGGVTITGTLALTGNWAQGNGGVLSLANTTATSGSGTFSASTATNTVNYTANGNQTLEVPDAGTAGTYYHLGLNGTGANTKTMTSITAITGNLTTAGTAATSGFVVATIGGNVDMSDTSAITTGQNLTITGTLIVGSGTVFTTGANWTLGVTSTTSVTGTLANSNTGTKTYTGAVTINATGIWSTGACTINFKNNFTNNSAASVTFTGSSVLFDANTPTIGGSNGVSVPTLTVTGVTLINGFTSSASLTVSSSLAGTGTLQQATDANLYITGAVTVNTLDAATNSGNTVDYNGASPTCKTTQYYHLKFTGSSTVTCTPTSPNLGNVTVGGTALWTHTTALTINGTLTISGGTLTTGAVAFTVNGITTISSGTLSLTNSTGNKTLTGLVTLNGGTLSGASTAIILGGGIANAAGTVSITGTAAMNTASGVLTATNAIAIANINVGALSQAFSGAGGINVSGTLTVDSGAGTAVTNTNTANIAAVTMTSGTLLNNGTLILTGNLTGAGGLTQGASAALTLGGTSTITTLTATAGTNTVSYTGTGQTIKDTTYENLTVSGTISTGTQTATVAGVFNVDGGTFTPSAGTMTFNDGSSISNSGSLTFVNVSIASSAGVSTSASFYVSGNWSSGGSFVASAGTITFNGADESTQAFTGNSSFKNFTATTASNSLGRILQFAGTSETTVTGTWTITGYNLKVITLQSSNTDNWTITPTGSAITYVDVHRSTWSGTPTCATFSTKDGYTLNWTVAGGASCNTAPNVPSAPAQKKTDNTVLAVGDWTNETDVKFTATASDTDNPDTLYLCVEKKAIADAFTGPEDGCSSPGVAYSGTPVEVTVTIAGVTDTQYHWRARVKDAGGLYSAWVAYGSNPAGDGTTDGSPANRDYGIDTSKPTLGDVYDGTEVGVDTDFSTTSLSALSANWANFNATVSDLDHYDYSIGTTQGGVDIRDWTGNSTTTSVTASGLTLQTSQVYYFNVRAVDKAGNTQDPVMSSDGQVITPSLSFGVLPTTLPFANLNDVNGYTDTEEATLTTSTNAYGGYVVRAYITDNLRSTDGNNYTILDFNGGSYASPDEWLSSDRGFGYTSSDPLVQEVNKFGSSPCAGGNSPPCYAPFNHTPPGDIIADHTANVSGDPITGEVFTITCKVMADNSKEAANYVTTIVYTITAQY